MVDADDIVFLVHFPCTQDTEENKTREAVTGAAKHRSVRWKNVGKVKENEGNQVNAV
jgi:hypothetical protein